MALKSFLEWKHNGSWLKSGEIYSFKYRNFEHDPEPLIILLNVIKGIHPTSGHRWNLFQGINLHYIPRKDRKIFADDWYIAWKYSSNIEFTWKHVTNHFPYLKFGIRRYLMDPVSYVYDIKKIEKEKYDKVIVGSIWKDYSEHLKRKIISKLRKIKK